MLKKFIYLLLAFALWSGSATADPILSLVQAERDFARMSVEKGMRNAFLAFLAQGSIVFRPRAVDARKWATDRPDSPAVLSWQPAYAGVSSAGDLGFTTGPYEFRRNSGEEPAGYGEFLSVWKKQSGGEWKVILDIGISHDKPVALLEDVGISPVPVYKATSAKARERELKNLLVKDDKFSGSGLGDVLANDVILLRDQAFPVSGMDSVRSVLAASPETFQDSREGSGISDSADLGYTYGTYSLSKDTAISGTFVRIWKKLEDWNVAVDLRVPDPPK